MVLGLLTVMTLKRVRLKVKDENEHPNNLMVYKVVKIINPSQGKKHLMTQ